MLDGWVRCRIDPRLNRMGQGLARAGVSADATTLLGLGAGLASAFMLAMGLEAAALFLFVLNRGLDGLDGAIARASRRTDLGAFLDSVCDFTIYGAIPLAFALRDPATNAMPAAVLLMSLSVNGASFLAFTSAAAKRGITEGSKGIRPIYYTFGSMESTETILFFVAMMLAPGFFPVLAYAFAGLTFMSALGRMGLAWYAFRDENGETD